MSGDSLPSGTFTFLFSDVEGSTRLLQDLGDDYVASLEAHRTIVREAIRTNHGNERTTEGDSFFVVFDSASDALRAAVQMQSALAAADWPGSKPVKIRIGIHTGEATLHGAQYIGLAVHQAARVASAANGGQILISESTRILVADALPAGGRLDDLGLHRLKDLDRPLRLYRVGHDSLDTSRPPRTLDAQTHNLPVQATPFTGRFDEIEALRKIVADSDGRLVTLVGPGGIGKTRLALQTAAECVGAFPDGVWFVPLASVADADAVPAEIARTIGARETEELTPSGAVLDEVAGKSMLLLLDNLEHVLDCAAFVAQILAAAPNVKVLATSREPLRLSAEHVHPVPPMDLASADDPLEALSRSDAIVLFVERTRARDPRFVLDGSNAAAVADICRRLDGLPLAIELAAARAADLGAAALAERLREGLDALGGGPDDAPDRHRTLESAVTWSYDMLDDRQQTILRKLSIFVSSFDEDGASTVADASTDDLVSLADRSLLRRIPEATMPRFEMLVTIRDVVRRKLERSGEFDATFEAYASYVGALAADLRSKIHSVEVSSWLAKLDEAQDDIGAMLDRQWERDGRAAADLTSAVSEYWAMRGRFDEAKRRLQRAIDSLPDDSIERARAIVAFARLRLKGRLSRSRRELAPLLLDALTVAQSRGDKLTEALALLELAPHVIESSFMAGLAGAEAPNAEMRRRAIATLESQPRGRKASFSTKHVLERAAALADEVGDAALSDEIRTSPFFHAGLRGAYRAITGSGGTVASAIVAAQSRGDRAAEAELLLRQALGPLRAREAALRRALDIGRELGDERIMMQSLGRLADLHNRRKDFLRALSYAHEALDRNVRSQEPLDPEVLFHVATVASEAGDFRTYERVRAYLRSWGGGMQAFTLRVLGPFMVMRRWSGMGTLAAGAAWIGAFASPASNARTVALIAIGYFFTQALDTVVARPAYRLFVSGHDALLVAWTVFAFGVATLSRQERLGGVLLFVALCTFSNAGLLRGKVFGPTAKPVTAVLLIAGLVASVASRGIAAPIIALVVVAHGAVRATNEEMPDVAWAVLRVGADVARASAAFIGMHVIASKLTDGEVTFRPWQAVGSVALVAGLVVAAVVLVATDPELRPGGVLLAVSAAGLPLAFASPDGALRLVAGSAFGLAWLAVGIGMVRTKRLVVPELFPPKYADYRPVSKASQALP